MAFPALALVGLSVASSLIGGRKAKKAAKANARAIEEQAKEDVRISRRETSALMGRQRAIIAAQGTTVEGSPLLIMEDTAIEAELEALAIRKTAAARSGAARREGRAAMSSALFNAGGMILRAL